MSDFEDDDDFEDLPDEVKDILKALESKLGKPTRIGKGVAYSLDESSKKRPPHQEQVEALHRIGMEWIGAPKLKVGDIVLGNDPTILDIRFSQEPHMVLEVLVHPIRLVPDKESIGLPSGARNYDVVLGIMRYKTENGKLISYLCRYLADSRDWRVASDLQPQRH